MNPRDERIKLYIRKQTKACTIHVKVDYKTDL